MKRRRKRRNEASSDAEISLAAEASEKADQAKSLPQRIARYSTAKKRALAMLDYLSGIENEPIPLALNASLKLRHCGNYLHFHHYYTQGEVRLHAAQFCKQHLICPLCAIRRGAKSLEAYLLRYQAIKATYPTLNPYLITFTVRNGENLEERLKHLQKNFKTLQDRRRFYLAGKRGSPWTELVKVQGAVGSYELTNIGNGWHPHLHMIALSHSEPLQADLKAEWEKTTEDSFMVDVRPFRASQDESEAFLEVFKYAVKFSSLSLEDNWHAARELAGKRLLFSFGCFRGVKVPDSLADEPLDGLPYLDLFYRYFADSGYTLTGELPPKNNHGRTANKTPVIG